MKMPPFPEDALLATIILLLLSPRRVAQGRSDAAVRLEAAFFCAPRRPSLSPPARIEKRGGNESCFGEASHKSDENNRGGAVNDGVLPPTSHGMGRRKLRTTAGSRRDGRWGATNETPFRQGDADAGRLSIESDAVATIRRCKSVIDVDRALRDCARILACPVAAYLSPSHVSGSRDDDCVMGGAGWGGAKTDRSYLTSIGPNVAAAAVRRITDVRLNRAKRGGKQEVSNAEASMAVLDDANAKVARLILPPLLGNVGSAVLLALRKLEGPKEAEGGGEAQSDGLTPPPLSPYAIQDLLHSLAKLESSIKAKPSSERGEENHDKGRGFRPLAEKVCNLAVSTDNAQTFVTVIGPKRLVDVLTSLAALNFCHRHDLLRPIGDRLSMGDATGALSAKELTAALWAYAVLHVPHAQLMKSFARRLRKKAVRDTASGPVIARAVWSAGRLAETLDFEGLYDCFGSDEQPLGQQQVAVDDDLELCVAMLRSEVETMCYTLTRALLGPATAREWPKQTSDSGPTSILCTMSAGQVADVLSGCVTFELGNDETALIEICNYLTIQDGPLEGSTSRDISRILWSMQRLQLKGHPETVRCLGERFLHLVETGRSRCDSKTVNTILRSAALLQPGKKDVIQPFCKSCRLLLEEKSPFLASCNEFEVSNFAWFMAMSRWYDKHLFLVLGERMRQGDILESCSPSSASRMLWSYTTLLSLSENEGDVGGSADDDDSSHGIYMRERLFELFQSLGGILLSAQLTPVDASSAMFAYGKASYSLDMGIFDHLAESLASDFMLERATVRQVSQALWSCGRMVSWEDPLGEPMDFGARTTTRTPTNHPQPPYRSSARRFGSFLASLRDSLSTKDVAQALWALGKLQITDESIVRPLAESAAKIAPRCNSQEIANILYGLSKVGHENQTVVSALTDCMASPAVRRSCTTQEAANVMYALGRMKIRDEGAFGLMSSVIMEQLGNATAQAIANALWAHEAVRIQPPTELLDSWAEKKLGITGLLLHKPGEIGVIVDNLEQGRV